MKLRLIGLGTVVVFFAVVGLYFRSPGASRSEPVGESSRLRQEPGPLPEPSDSRSHEYPASDAPASEPTVAETGNAAPPPATRAFEEPKQGEEAGPTGSVVDVVTGLPVSGLKLYLSEEPSAVTTDDEGLFELPVLPPGAYSILIQDDFIFMANGQRSVSS